jgi:hypothetical protein
MTNEDKALIKETSDLLKQLKPLLNKVEKFICEPIDTTEGEFEYRKMLTESMMNITKGKIYKCYYQKGEDAYTIINDIGNMDKDWDVGCFEDKTYTHAEFLAQEQGKEWKEGFMPKYGEWFKNDLGSLFLRTGKIGIIEGDTQDGTIVEFYTHTWLSEPTPEEIQSHLVAIAEKRYPVGATFINLYSNVRQIVANHKYTHYKNGELRVNGGLVWHNGKWAEQAPIETEQRWKVNVERTYDHLNEYRIIVELDEKNGLNKERADKAAEAIKQYLSINQF